MNGGAFWLTPDGRYTGKVVEPGSMTSGGRLHDRVQEGCDREPGAQFTDDPEVRRVATLMCGDPRIGARDQMRRRGSNAESRAGGSSCNAAAASVSVSGINPGCPRSDASFGRWPGAQSTPGRSSASPRCPTTRWRGIDDLLREARFARVSGALALLPCLSRDAGRHRWYGTEISGPACSWCGRMSHATSSPPGAILPNRQFVGVLLDGPCWCWLPCQSPAVLPQEKPRWALDTVTTQGGDAPKKRSRSSH